MKIVSLIERSAGENRVSMSPEVVKLFVRKGFDVMVEDGLGLQAGFSRNSYVEAGAKVSADLREIISDADIILKVQPTSGDACPEVDFAKPATTIIGLLSPYTNSDYLQKLVLKKLTAISMELLPRTTKAQAMDALSSQSNLAGYRSVIEASYHFTKAFPMMMTPSGTIPPCKLLVIGTGVAGLQAIATAKRLGANVSGYDIRAATKEQVESLGAKFISPEMLNRQADDKSGYATELSNEDKTKAAEFLASIIKNYDIVITTAQIPGKIAPILITSDMLQSMKFGSVIVDIATSSGGNVEGSMIDEIVVKDGITIIGYGNLPSRIPCDSSRLYSKNLYNLLDYALLPTGFNFEDEMIKQMLIVKDGAFLQEKFKKY